MANEVRAPTDILPCKQCKVHLLLALPLHTMVRERERERESERESARERETERERERERESRAWGASQHKGVQRNIIV